MYQEHGEKKPCTTGVDPGEMKASLGGKGPGLERCDGMALRRRSKGAMVVTISAWEPL